MICANVRNRLKLTGKCNNFVDSPFSFIGHNVVKTLLLTPKKTIYFQLLSAKIDP